MHRLELEVTESALINDAETARDVLDGLVKSGIKIALDDFGTGYSSLSQLSNYQFNKIKIDRSFVASFEECDRQEKIVRAIIALGIGLGVKITAEGIEDASQLRRLQTSDAISVKATSLENLAPSRKRWRSLNDRSLEPIKHGINRTHGALADNARNITLSRPFERQAGCNSDRGRQSI